MTGGRVGMGRRDEGVRAWMKMPFPRSVAVRTQPETHKAVRVGQSMRVEATEGENGPRQSRHGYPL